MEINDRDTVIKVYRPELIEQKNNSDWNIDFNIQDEVAIPIKVIHDQKLKPGEKYPTVFPGMTEKDFSTWKISYLQEFLSDREVNKTGNKSTLVQNSYHAYKLNLKVRKNDAMEEENHIKEGHKQKLILENGTINLPDPCKLIEGWYKAPKHLPSTLYNDIQKYLEDNNAGKAFKGGKSLFQSGHLVNVFTHNISHNVRYCFARASLFP